MFATCFNIQKLCMLCIQCKSVGVFQLLEQMAILFLNIVNWSRTCEVTNRIFRRVCKIAKNDYYFRDVCLSVRTHGTSRLPLDGFSWNLMFECSSKICVENSSFIKIWRE